MRKFDLIDAGFGRGVVGVWRLEVLEGRELYSVADGTDPQDDDQGHGVSCSCGACCGGGVHFEGDGHDHGEYIENSDGIYYIDPALPADILNAGDADDLDGTGFTPSLSEVFQLHSNPGASKVIYLDFDGHTTNDSSWNSGVAFTSDAYSRSGSVDTFDASDRGGMYRIWARMAEDFLPFDVDVTTEDPGVEALRKSGSGDTHWGNRVVISGTSDWYGGGAGGVAYVGSFDWGKDTPSFVFTSGVGTGSKNVAEAGSHEVGHTLGLSHDGKTDGTGYYGGHGSGDTGWASIMGVGYYKNVSQWSQGEYDDANQHQDDLQIITSQNGFGYRVDEVGDDLQNAGYFQGSGSGVNYRGLIERRADVDFFRFDTSGGVINLNIEPAAIGPNLDIEVKLYDFMGNVLDTFNPTDSLFARIENYNLGAGTYYLSVDGVGKGDLSSGYNDYASLGFYSIKGTVPSVDVGLDIGAVGSWSFGDIINGEVVDGTGNGFDGVVHGAYENGNIHGLYFDGVDDYVEIGDPEGLRITGEITLSAWVGANSKTGYRSIIQKGLSSRPTREIFMRIKDGMYQVGSADEDGVHMAEFEVPVGGRGTWHHLVGVYDGQSWNLYLNGELVDSNADNTGAVDVPSPWAIGAVGSGGARFFSGRIADVAIFDRAISEAQIERLAGNGSGNLRPVGADFALTTDEDVAVVTVNLADAAVDPEGGVVVLSGVIQPDHGIAVVNADGTVTYTPHENYHGSDRFMYFVTDEQGGVGSGFIDIEIASVADGPLLVTDEVVGLSGGNTEIDVLANDTHPEGYSFSLLSVNDGVHGQTWVNRSGHVVYKSEPWFVGEDVFTYTAKDSEGAVSTGEVRVTINNRGISYERFNGINGTSVNDLKNSSKYPNRADEKGILDSFEIPRDVAENYGVRLRGYVTPLVTGTYTFYIASDDGGELRMSADGSDSGASRIAYVSGWSSYQEWDKFSSQTSSGRELVAGQRYYVEALVKEGGGGDHLSIGWTGPGFSEITVITGEYLTAYGVDTRMVGDATGNGVVDGDDVDAVAVGFGGGYGLSSLFAVRNAMKDANPGGGGGPRIELGAVAEGIESVVSVGPAGGVAGAVEWIDLLVLPEDGAEAVAFVAAENGLAEGRIEVKEVLGNLGEVSGDFGADRDTRDRAVDLFDLIVEDEGLFLV